MIETKPRRSATASSICGERMKGGNYITKDHIRNGGFLSSNQASCLSNSHPCLLETHKATTAKGVKRMEM